MEWPASFYELRRGEGCPMCEQGRPEERRRKWSFQYPEEAPSLEEDDFRADVEALRA